MEKKGRRGKERRRGRGREEEEEKKRSHDKKGMELTLDMEHMSFVWLLVVSNLGFLLGFHPNPIIIESKVDKTIKSTRSI